MGALLKIESARADSSELFLLYSTKMSTFRSQLEVKLKNQIP